MRTHLAMLGACLAIGCSSAPTELLVVVDSDLATPTELDAIRIVITHPDGTQTRESMAALGAGDPPLPRSLAMVHQGGPLGPYRVAVEGRLGGAVQVERVGGLTFVPGAIRVWRVTLASACLSVDCPEQTCDGGSCREVAVGQGELEPYTPDVPRDAGPPRDSGVDAGTDAGTDAGRVCVSDCSEGSCTCEGGCSCAMTCPASGCAPTCRGAGTTCTVDASPGVGTVAACATGATCLVDASASSGFEMDCTGAGTRCEVDCSTTTGCLVRCAMGAQCVLDCSGASSCEIRPCSGGVTTCTGGVQVCGTTCP